MSRRAHARVFAVLALALCVLHFDLWNHQRVDPILLGWMPVDLAYHVAWVGAATALVLYLCARVWPDEPSRADDDRGA